jgi:division protein CdvB (Snf7/Vps24/ESCRT-III family)
MVMETINPTIELVKDIQKEISNVVPSANGVISEVSSITSDVIINSNVKIDMNKVSAPIDSEAVSILNEVEGILEDEAKVRLPEIPAAIETVKVSGKTEKPVLGEEKLLLEG